jgi:hypothetical protein
MIAKTFVKKQGPMDLNSSSSTEKSVNALDNSQDAEPRLANTVGVTDIETPTHTATIEKTERTNHQLDTPAANDHESSSQSSSSVDGEGGLHLIASSSTASLSHPPVQHIKIGKSQKVGHAIACQVDEGELLAKTIATQVNDEDLQLGPRIFRPIRIAMEDDQRSEMEKDDFVEDHHLRPVPSSSQLHGILRKAPSAKWGSQSTVCFDEHGYDRSRSTSIIDQTDGLRSNKHSDLSLRDRSGSHNDLKKHRNGSIKKKLAMFHLGQNDDHEPPSKEVTPSESGSADTTVMAVLLIQFERHQKDSFKGLWKKEI